MLAGQAALVALAVRRDVDRVALLELCDLRLDRVPAGAGGARRVVRVVDVACGGGLWRGFGFGLVLGWFERGWESMGGELFVRDGGGGGGGI